MTATGRSSAEPAARPSSRRLALFVSGFEYPARNSRPSLEYSPCIQEAAIAVGFRLTSKVSSRKSKSATVRIAVAKGISFGSFHAPSSASNRPNRACPPTSSTSMSSIITSAPPVAVRRSGRVGPGGAAMAAVNVRCLEGVELTTLKRVPVDGRSM